MAVRCGGGTVYIQNTLPVISMIPCYLLHNKYFYNFVFLFEKCENIESTKSKVTVNIWYCVGWMVSFLLLGTPIHLGIDDMENGNLKEVHNSILWDFIKMQTYNFVMKVSGVYFQQVVWDKDVSVRPDRDILWNGDNGRETLKHQAYGRRSDSLGTD